MPKLSIITINLNNNNGLKRSIESVLSQSFKDIEYLIIDGGSIDGSLETIKQYSTSINYWSSEKDNGIYNAMNKGIKKSNGEYCFFLNSGDYFVSSKVIADVFKDDPKEDVVFGNLYTTVNDKITTQAIGKESLKFSDVFSHTIKHQASFIKKELFQKFGLYNENRRIVSDWEFFIKTVGFGNATYKYTNTFVTYFDNAGMSNNNPEITQKEKLIVIKENIPALMHKDYEFLDKYSKYLKVFDNKLAFLLIRLINKILIR